MPKHPHIHDPSPGWVLSWLTAKSHAWRIRPRPGDPRRPGQVWCPGSRDELGEIRLSPIGPKLQSRVSTPNYPSHWWCQPRGEGSRSGHRFPGAVFCKTPNYRLLLKLSTTLRSETLARSTATAGRAEPVKGRHKRNRGATESLGPGEGRLRPVKRVFQRARRRVHTGPRTQPRAEPAPARASSRGDVHFRECRPREPTPHFTRHRDRGGRCPLPPGP